MSMRTATAVLAIVAVAACEQTDQPLPFSLEDVEVVTRTVTPSIAATVSTPAGASVQFPAGSVTASTSVSIQQVTPPATTEQSGTASSAAYRLEPAGTPLANPAAAELRFSAGVNSRDAWLASLVNTVGGSVQELGNTRVDVSAGLAEARIGRLGTLTVVIPDPRAVIRAQRTSARRSMARVATNLAATGTDSISVNCGDPNNRCKGIVLEASDTLLNRVDDVAAVYPRTVGTLRINGTTASGALEASTSVRFKLQAGASAENLSFTARMEPRSGQASQNTVVTEDASSVTLTNVRLSISGTNSDGSKSATRETLETVVINKATGGGNITVRRTFTFRTSTGRLEEMYVRLVVPVQVHQ